MDKNKQKIAIAEHCGWKYLPKDSYGIQWVTPPKGTQPKKHVPSAPFAPSDVPDYCNDLNAMHEAEDYIQDPYKVHVGIYEFYLKKRVGNEWGYATAAQRAEAFLRTIGKWDDVE